ncbi:MAG: glycosyltransferase family 2 protein [Acidobacteria bacterium]|nr:glycosyltransferase family 2 protein [Acidobacteriota bacterium]
MGAHLKESPRNADAINSTAGVTLSVIIPALNEEDGIEEILANILKTREALETAGVHGLEVIVVDDGSEDDTTRIVERTPEVRLIRHPSNRGYGAAIKTGFRNAKGELLAFLDADSTYPPEHLARLCKIALEENADVVIGSRRSGTETGMPAVRRLGNFFWSSLLSLIGSEKVQDPASGMRVLWRRCLDRIYPLPDGLNFTPVMSTRSLHEGLKVVEIPIPYRERSGRSKLSVVRDGLRFLWTIVWTALQYNPARIMELAGFVALAFAGIIGVSLIAARMLGVTELGPYGVFAVFVSLVFAVAGASVFSLGISFNYLIALHYRRPIRQVNLAEKILGSSPDRNFGAIGFSFGLVGAVLGIVSLALGIRGWEITRLWLWLLGSALFLLAGLQFVLFWVLIRVMRALSLRKERIKNDME